MKYKHIAIGLIALSLIAIAFVATVEAETIYSVTVLPYKKGKYIIFPIDTTSDTTHGVFSGLDVIKSSIVITIYVTSSYTIIINADPSSVTLTESSIIIQIVKQDLPKSALASHIIGNIGSSGDTFLASGPGWAFGNLR